MNTTIPTYNLEEYDDFDESLKEIIFSDAKLDSLKKTMNKPYRSNYYGLGLCISGNALLTGNLESYQILPNSIITMSPQVIKNWFVISEDFNILSILFTKSFFIKIFSNQNYFNHFKFFDQNVKHVNTFSKEETGIIIDLFEKIKEHTLQDQPYQEEILVSYINILLFEYQKIFEKNDNINNVKFTRNQQIVEAFKELVNVHFKKERSVKFYAEKLFITTKHLTEIVKLETGKTSRFWIDEMVILESKILLSNQSLQVSQIAETLHFPDISTFGKFFKNSTGTSPINYRKSL